MKYKTKRTIVIILTIAIIAALAVGIPLGILSRPKTDADDIVKRTKRENFDLRNRLPGAKQNQTMFIGDSIIEMYAVDEFFPNRTVYNRGISGDISKGVLDRLSSNALVLHPSVMVVLVGTNDLSRNIPVDDILKNYEAIAALTRSVSPNTKILFQSVYPVKKGVVIFDKGIARDKNAAIRDLNNKLKALCEKYSEFCLYVDVHTALCDDNQIFDSAYTYDGLHPNDVGYTVITKLLEEAFTNI